MSSLSHSVFWNGKKVGTISNPKIDNFFYYGNWQPDESCDVYSEFLSAINNNEYGASVDIGEIGSKLAGYILVEPDEEIEIRTRLLKSRDF